jgi:hypothetical protein
VPNGSFAVRGFETLSSAVPVLIQKPRDFLYVILSKMSMIDGDCFDYSPTEKPLAAPSFRDTCYRRPE